MAQFRCRTAVQILLVLGVVSLPCLPGASAQEPGTALRSPTLDRIQENGVLRVGATLSYPPGVYKDPTTGEPKGFNPAVAERMADRLKVTLEIIDTPFAGLIPGLQSGKFDILLTDLTPRPERALAATFAKPTVLFVMNLLVPEEKDCGKVADWNRDDVTLAVVQGAFTQFVATSNFPNATSIILEDPADAFLQTQDRRVDGMPNSNLVSIHWLKTHPEARLKLCFTEGSGLGAIPGAPVVPYGDLLFKEWVDQFFDDLINSGQYAEIYKQEMTEEPDMDLLRLFR